MKDNKDGSAPIEGVADVGNNATRRDKRTISPAAEYPRNLVSDSAFSGADTTLSSSSGLVSQDQYSSGSSSTGSSSSSDSNKADGNKADGPEVEEAGGAGLGCHVDHHPSAAAMYLDACVVFATLFGVSPVGAALPNGQFVGQGVAWSGGLSSGSGSGSGGYSSSSSGHSVRRSSSDSGISNGDSDDDNHGGDPSILPVGLRGVSPDEALELQRIAEAVVLGPLRGLWQSNI